jgi:hypothetical protein
MYNLFDQKNAETILSRVEKLQSSTQAQWGKMNVAQMMAHCSVTLETPFAPDMPQSFMGKLFGKMAKKPTLSNEPFRKNSPTDKRFLVQGSGNFDAEKQKLIGNIKRFTQAGPNGITCKKHPFFGEFTSENWSHLMHKHLDHHLKQFGV